MLSSLRPGVAALVTARLATLGVVAAALAACGPADGAPAEALGEGAAAIKGGEKDELDTAVVAFVNAADGSLCSGSLIAPNLVLTARHCVSEVLDTVGGGVLCGTTRFGDIVRPESFFVTTAAVVTKGNIGQLRVHDVVGLPDARRSVCGDDVALLVLDGDVDAATATPYEPRLVAPLAKGDGYTAIGYGAIDDGSAGAGTRRVRKGLTVACVGADCASENVTDTELTGDTGICHGDSGGPAVDTDGRVAGLVSRGKAACDAPIYEHVQAYADFIKDAAVVASGWGKYDPPAWTAGSNESPQHGMAVGAPCGTDTDCYSSHCVLPAGYCSRECDDAAACPTDYACSKGAPRLCIDTNPPAAAAGTPPGASNTGNVVSCSTRVAGGARGGELALVACALAAVARRRRRAGGRA